MTKSISQNVAKTKKELDFEKGFKAGMKNFTNDKFHSEGICYGLDTFDTPDYDAFSQGAYTGYVDGKGMPVNLTPDDISLMEECDKNPQFKEGFSKACKIVGNSKEAQKTKEFKQGIKDRLDILKRCHNSDDADELLNGAGWELSYTDALRDCRYKTILHESVDSLSPNGGN